MSNEEQLEDGSLEPRGEHREDSFLLSRTGRRDTQSRRGSTMRDGIPTDIAPPPENIQTDYQQYYIEFPFVQAALKIFDETVIEPGWEVEAIRNDEIDPEMTEALNMWGEKCAIHAGEPGHDLIHLLVQCPSLRRAKPGVFIEKVGTRENPDAVAGLQLLDPSTITIRLRENQNLVVQPDDNVGPKHPRTDTGTPAAYVQYDEQSNQITGTSDEEPIPFGSNDLIKLVYDPEEGSPWGRTIWPAVKPAIDGLKRKLSDRNAAIRLAGHPHRIYSSDTWTKDEAEEFANAHEEGRASSWDIDEEMRADGFASRIDFVPNVVQVETVSGEVADIKDAIQDDIEAIFSVMPVSKFKIAYEDKINQFVVEPQERKDELWVNKERRYLESKFQEIFEEKADELAGGYDGKIYFRIRQPVSENPLERDGFDPERFKMMIDAFSQFSRTDAVADFPRELVYFMAGMEKDKFEEKYDIDMSEEIDEDDEDIQDAASALEIGEDEDEDEDEDEE